MYPEEVMDLYSERPNYGRLKSSSVSANEINPSCGDELDIDLIIENGIVKEVGYTNKKGCFVTLLAASVLTEKIKGMKVEDIKKMDKKDIDKLLGEKVIETRISCELLPLEAIKKAIMKLK